MNRAVAIFLCIPFQKACLALDDRPAKRFEIHSASSEIFFVNSKYLVYFRYSIDLSVAEDLFY
jgi:hypothetical protein